MASLLGSVEYFHQVLLESTSLYLVPRTVTHTGPQQTVYGE